MSVVTDLERLHRDGDAEGRRAVVGALIFDERGRLFVHRRGEERRFLPNCWDIVGGHVEPGETVLEALARELHEETGWTLRGTPRLLHLEDWTMRHDPRELRREFDFIVEVSGDLAHPVLERPKHVEFRWIAPSEVALLDENRGEDDGFIRRLAELAFATVARHSQESNSS